MILYRPVGQKERDLIAETGYSAFPPRLPEQPIFYPVLTLEYAAQIAQDWDATTPPYAGYVTRFEIENTYSTKFEVHLVGGRNHRELWVPAEELTEFNRHLIGKIEVVKMYFGEQKK